MKIDKIHVDGFGVWNDRTWEDLAPGINVFHGPNETGKSTLMGFVRAVLFGFERRGSSRRYEPLNGGNYGGWLELGVDGRAVRVERKAGRHVRGAVAVFDGDAAGGEPELEKLLHGTTRTLYHNVFAFGLEELEQFHTLQDNEIAQHITGAGLGIGAARWSNIQRDLETRQSALFLPRGQNGTINVALKELDAVREDLDRTEQQPAEYWQAHESGVQLAAEVEALEETVAALKQRAAHLEKRLKSRPLWERRRKLQEQLQALPAVEHFPEGGLERLELIRNRLDALKAEHDATHREIEQRRLWRIELRSAADPAEQANLTEIIDAMRSLLPRVEAARRMYDAALDRQDAAVDEKMTMEAAAEGMHPPSKTAFFLFMALLWIGVLGLAGSGFGYAAAAVLALSATPALWYRSRLAVARNAERQREASAERYAACVLEVATIESEARDIEADIRTLTGKSEITQYDIDVRVTALERLLKAAEELRHVDENLERAEAALERIDRELQHQKGALESLFAAAGAANEQQFFERAEIYRQRQQLDGDLVRIPLDAAEPGMLFDIYGDEEEAYETARRELAVMEQQLAEARRQSGRIEERMATMERSEERSRAFARQESIQAKIDESAELWAIVTLCRTLLDETRKVYETERQPEVLQQASFFFKVMTEGRYARVIAPLDGTEIQVERSDGSRLPPQLLSRGTAEQLYLAMRLALVREYARQSYPLPVVFDDILVNFDPHRTRNTVRAIQALAETHQVLFFTCHPHLVDQFHEIVPQAKVFPLQ